MLVYCLCLWYQVVFVDVDIVWCSICMHVYIHACQHCVDTSMYLHICMCFKHMKPDLKQKFRGTQRKSEFPSSILVKSVTSKAVSRHATRKRGGRQRGTSGDRIRTNQIIDKLFWLLWFLYHVTSISSTTVMSICGSYPILSYSAGPQKCKTGF